MTNKKVTKVLIFDLDDTLFDSTNQPEDNGKDWDIKIFDGLLPVLTSTDYIKILVTKGEEKLQKRKIDTLKLNDYFFEIYIVKNDNDKYDQFKKIVKNFPNEEIIVIGNRIDQEIRYGNMLGLKTVFVKHGKYKGLVAKDESELPTCTIESDDLLNLTKIL